MNLTLEAARVNKKLTQDDMAAEFGINRSTYSRWENNPGSVTGDRMDKICDILGIRRVSGNIFTFADASPQAANGSGMDIPSEASIAS